MAGEWCLILGASSGMGRACALALSRQGMNVVGVHLDGREREDEVNELVASLRQNGVDVHFFNENAAGDPNRASIIASLPQAVREAGGFKVLVHSLAFGTLLPFVGRSPGEPIISRRQMDMTLSVMANSLVYWVQDLLAHQLLTAGARIFALTSAGSTRVSRHYGAVSAAKAALESHVRQLALELAPLRISVNAVRAGVTLTPSLERIPGHEELVERARRFNPHQRLTQPEDVAQAIALLSAASSSWITGNVVGVDGGEILAT
jgi:NAD(P)-dependent dehydrogenase (short-subunit alcohol dehydrogenase family)